MKNTPKRIQYVIIQNSHFNYINALMALAGVVMGFSMAKQTWSGFWWAFGIIVVSIIYQFVVGGQPRKLRQWEEYEDGE